jgi:hypothetical protein
MDRVASLSEMDLSAVLGVSMTAEAQLRLIGIGRRIDSLRLPGDQPGWIIGNGPQAVSAGQPLPLALGTALGRRCEPDDCLELALDIWYAIEKSFLVSATVEVAYFCGIDHGTHAAASAEWTAKSANQLLTALGDAAGVLTGWSGEDVSPDLWRRRAGLPQR